jgi:hypothetical protein
MSHTPGPWSVEYDTDGKLHVTAGEFLDLAEVGLCQGGDPEANARVMSSAPDLLALCIQSRALMVTMLGDELDKPESKHDQIKITVLRTKIAALSAAIARATGGEV